MQRYNFKNIANKNGSQSQPMKFYVVYMLISLDQ